MTFAFAVLAAFAASPRSAFAVWDGEVGVSGLNYAQETKPSGRVDFSTRAHSEAKVDGDRFAAGELRILGFVESGAIGDRSIDLDPAAYRFQVGDSWNHHFWLGRVHPLEEQDPSVSISHRSAVGANWVQNQSDPLDPRVVGWVGTGFHGEIPGTGLGVTAAYSPLFLPTFGPRVEYSESADASGSRFGRRPPETIRLNDNAIVPMRYRIETGDIKNIVLQQQAFVSLDHTSAAGTFSAVAWTAPASDPSVDIDGKLRVTSSNADVLAIAKPTFDRQKFTGFIYRNPGFFAEPELQIVREWTGANTAVSAAIRPLSFLRAGALHTFSATFNQLPAEGSEAVDSPKYARELVWMSLEHRFERWAVTPTLTWEQHLEEGRKDGLLEGAVTYEPSKRIALFAATTVIAGEDRSYLGTWRGLDSARFGVRCVW